MKRVETFNLSTHDLSNKIKIKKLKPPLSPLNEILYLRLNSANMYRD